MGVEKKKGFCPGRSKKSCPLTRVSDRRGFNELQPCSKYSPVVLSER